MLSKVKKERVKQFRATSRNVDLTSIGSIAYLPEMSERKVIFRYKAQGRCAFIMFYRRHQKEKEREREKQT